MPQTGRAELLLALRMGAGHTLALEHDEQGWWGYAPAPKSAPAGSAEAVGADLLRRPPPPPPPTPDPPPHEDPLRQPLQMPLAWVLVQQTKRDLGQDLQHLPPLGPEDLRALSPAPLPCRDLVPWARALPGIRRHTDRQVTGAVDWPRLSQALAQQDTPSRWPRLCWQRWPHQLMVVLDFSPALDPFRWDFHRLAGQLAAQVPAAALSVRVLQHGPFGPWSPWPRPRRGQQHPLQPPQPWERRLQPGTTVLVASDLGLFSGQASDHHAWLDWADALHLQGCRLVALAPVAAAQLTAATVERFELLRWSPDSRWHRVRRAPEVADGAGAAAGTTPLQQACVAQEAAGTDALETLVALAATALRIDPPLLRAWRCLLPDGGDASLEGQLWNHTHLERGQLRCATRTEHREADLARHAQLAAPLREAAQAAHAAQHAHLRRSLGWAEALLWQAAGHPATAPPLAAAAHAPGAPAADDAALTPVKRLLRSLLALVDGSAATTAQSPHTDRLLGAAKLVQLAALPAVRAQDPALFAALDAALAQARALAAAAAGASPASLATPAAQRLCMLVQQGPTLALVGTGAPDPGQVLGMPVLVSPDVQGVGLRSGAASNWLPWQAPKALDEPMGLELARLGDSDEPLTITLGPHTWQVQPVVRPRWAARWQQAQGQASAAVPVPGSQQATGQPEWAWFAQPWQPQQLQGLADGRVQVGLDQHGAYAELQLQLPHSARRQPQPAVPPLRMRWIPAGRFMMGSPEGAGAADEHPQHPVLISQGFWLAEGPCTQALWQAVMGNNPSRFSEGADVGWRPVEQVSFEDVTAFLQRLRACLPPGCEPVLPTEAQWEYAARADSTTAYPWGDRPDDARANWNGQRKGTTVVGHYPPNAWGLLDMHGNVWEWCLDGARGYSKAPARDPLGDLAGPSRRAVRGGSWINHPDGARSAYRYGWPPGARHRNQGFRFALRSSSPEAGGLPAAPARGPGGAAVGAGRPDGDGNWLSKAAQALGSLRLPSTRRDGGKKGPF